tara:strand:+ start:3641 stop:3754 length:114 start_codon:yes stop_codon:yes gene_type:complete
MSLAQEPQNNKKKHQGNALFKTNSAIIPVPLEDAVSE